MYAFPAQSRYFSAAYPPVPMGSTVLIKAGAYKIGLDGIPNAESTCSAAAAFDCTPTLVSGSSAQPTRVLGEGFDSGCSNPPELWGTDGLDAVLTLTSLEYVEVNCLEITDRSNCIVAHNASSPSPYKCTTGTWAETGIYAPKAKNITLKNLEIHGMAVTGIWAGALQNWSLDQVKINANGFVGWDLDVNCQLGECSGSSSLSSNSGTFTIRNSEISHNGCTEDYPSTTIVGCWDQDHGGYGDGMGAALSSGTWLFEDVNVIGNASDGIDLLYLRDGASVTFRRVTAKGNAGNQLKTTGAVTLEDSVVVSSCGNFPVTPYFSSGRCRAQGNTLSLNAHKQSELLVRNNTIGGEGDCLVLTTCQTCQGQERLKLYNNILIGDKDFLVTQGGSSELACFVYHEGPGSVTRDLQKNIIWNTKENYTQSTCPSGNLCVNPQLKNTGIYTFDPALTLSSPAINAANPALATLTDLLGLTRGNAPDIGAIEFRP
jgi:Right handed beta helix region